MDNIAVIYFKFYIILFAFLIQIYECSLFVHFVLRVELLFVGCC